jgi:hypothetical protein
MADTLLSAICRVDHAALWSRPVAEMECLLKAREYRRHGHQDVQTWIDNAG